MVGTKAELKKAATKYLNYSIEGTIEDDLSHSRGLTYDCLKGGKHPLVLIDGDLPQHIAIATLAHEAVHVVNFIEDYLGINDTSREFVAHGVGAIMRAVLKKILK